MMTEQTLEKLYDMKLIGMAEAFAEQLQTPDLNDLPFEDRFALIVDRHWTWKEDRRMTRLLKNAKLKDNACIEDIDFKTPRCLDKSVILRLANTDWINKYQNIIITGPTGVGKTYLACALANRACRNGFTAIYKRAPRLYQEVAIARADGSYPKLMNKIAKMKVMIIDDFCITPMADAERRDLLEIIEDRQGIGSTVVTTQLPAEHWYDHIGDPTLADAILDRLIHNAHKINLKGESMRKTRSALTKQNNSEK
jgi:DNA replication protein DnaC